MFQDLLLVLQVLANQADQPNLEYQEILGHPVFLDCLVHLAFQHYPEVQDHLECQYLLSTQQDPTVPNFQRHRVFLAVLLALFDLSDQMVLVVLVCQLVQVNLLYLKVQMVLKDLLLQLVHLSQIDPVDRVILLDQQFLADHLDLELLGVLCLQVSLNCPEYPHHLYFQVLPLVLLGQVLQLFLYHLEDLLVLLLQWRQQYLHHQEYL